MDKMVKYTKSKDREDGVPVHVYCRIRFMSTANSFVSCVKIISPTEIVIKPPKMLLEKNAMRPLSTTHTFDRVFSPECHQQEVYERTANDFVQNLIRGNSSLLMTYGLTGSGKTFTMIGDAECPGIMPRCLDVLFRTIFAHQSPVFAFKPNGANGFSVVSEEQAHLEEIKLLSTNSTTYGMEVKSDFPPNFDKTDNTAVSKVNPSKCLEKKNMYGVFISYVEIYNNKLFDLLDATSPRPQKPKMIREDINHNMYIYRGVEIEVKSTMEALRLFALGQSRINIRNGEPCRSHRVFSIRLVQSLNVHKEKNVKYNINLQKSIKISHLALVDLAGTMRISGSKFSEAQKFREICSVNKSLMALRSCLEALQLNRMNKDGVLRMVPSRDSKLTHLFKQFFEGEGQVALIICVNPSSDEYEESLQAMRFAEIPKEIASVSYEPSKKLKTKELLDLALYYYDDENFGNFSAEAPRKRSKKESTPEALLASIAKKIEQYENLQTEIIRDNFDADQITVYNTFLSKEIHCKNVKATKSMSKDISARDEKIRQLEEKLSLEKQQNHQITLDYNTKLSEMRRHYMELVYQLQLREERLSELTEVLNENAIKVDKKSGKGKKDTKSKRKNRKMSKDEHIQEGKKENA